MTAVDQLGPGEVGYIVAGIKDVGGRARARRSPRRPRPAKGARRLPRPQAHGLLRHLPDRRRRPARPARRARQAEAERRQITYEPESSKALGFGFRCGFLGLLAHGDRARAPRARVRPSAHRHGAVGRLPRLPHRRHRARRRQPDGAARPSRLDHIDEPMLAITILTPAGVPGHGDGPVPEPARRDGQDGLPLDRPGRAALHHPAGRGRHRLLRRS
jgi:GTP-binding protein LepA